MKPRILKKWLDALRSGEYQQTNSKLRDKHGYCCWGVLCDLHAQETGYVWTEHKTHGDEYFKYLGAGGLPPSEVEKWAGLESDALTESGESVFWKLAHLNDDGVEFTEIADHAEQIFSGGN